MTVVIVTFNSKNHVDRPLSALRRGYDEGILQCVVVDNASEDATPDYIAARHPWVRLVSESENRGFAAGCNLALQRADTPFVLFLNPDACIGLESVTALIDFLERTPGAGIAAPLIEDGDGTFLSFPAFPTPFRILSDAAGLRPTGWQIGQPCLAREDPPTEVDWVRGPIFIVRRSVIDELRGFDERFFLYFEEVDLCRRAHTAGWQVWAVPSAVGTHVGQGSVPPGARLQYGCLVEPYYNSRVHYLRKHFGVMSALAVELTENVLIGMRECLRRILGRQPRLPLASYLHRPVLRLPRSGR